MKICVMGAGNMGSAIAGALANRSTHEVWLRGSRSGKTSVAKVALETGVAEATDRELRASDIVFLAVPWAALVPAAGELLGYRGIVVSVVVPYGNDVEYGPRMDSAAEQLAVLLPDARIVNAFTSVSSLVVRDPGKVIGPSVIVCSDDAVARDQVMKLATDIGFDGVNGGGLVSARYAEGLGLLYMAIAYEGGYGPRVTFQVNIA